MTLIGTLLSASSWRVAVTTISSSSPLRAAACAAVAGAAALTAAPSAASELTATGGARAHSISVAMKKGQIGSSECLRLNMR